MDKITYRKAIYADIPFLVKAIIGAEKGVTDKMSYATLFGISETEAATYLRLMLEEDISGCELSVDSYLIAEVNGVVAGAVGGWKEAVDHAPSHILKGNLVNYIYPAKQIAHLTAYRNVLSGILIPRTANTFQIEYLYIDPAFRRTGLGSRLLQEHLNRMAAENSLDTVQMQLFDSSKGSLKLNTQIGFEIVSEKHSTEAIINELLPSNRKFLLEKQLHGKTTDH